MSALSGTTKLSVGDFFAQTDVSIEEVSSSSSSQKNKSSVSPGESYLTGSSNGNIPLNKYGTLPDTLSLAVSSFKTLPLRRLAIDLSLYLNLIILSSKTLVYCNTLSLSVLAALTDSLLDVISQLVLNYTEKHSTKSRSNAFYPAVSFCSCLSKKYPPIKNTYKDSFKIRELLGSSPWVF
jgi:hypothetical protein